MNKVLNSICVFSVLLSVFIISCHSTSNTMNHHIDIQGHRGCRGLMPENTIPAFKKALDIGVHTLELDVVVNKGGEVIVSHEPFFNHEISTSPDGVHVEEANEKEHNMYPLSLLEIQKYDVGMKPHPRFPLQKKIKTVKPSLTEMVTSVETYAIDEGFDSPLYNIEIKRKPEHDNSFHPDMKTFADTVLDTVYKLGIMDRTTIQCFDVPTLQYIHNSRPKVKLVYLIENIQPYHENLNKLGFKPYIYSPYFKLVNDELMNHARKIGMKVIPWTVNEEEEIKQMIDLKVDGIISDYPDRVVELIQAKKMQ